MVNDIKRWNERYISGDTPWETGVSNTDMKWVFASYVPKGESVLDIGCGIGTNAEWLASEGYIVTGIDVSDAAITQAKESATRKVLLIDYKQVNFLLDWETIKPHPVVFDCAVFHIFSEKEEREAFIRGISHACADGGFWINISCSKDSADKIEKETGVDHPPLMSLREIVEVGEPAFEVIEVKKSFFTVNRIGQGQAVYKAWVSVFRKR